MLEIFVKEGCPYCRQQMADFDRDGKSYKVHNVSSDSEALHKAKVQFKANKVPVVVEDGEVKSVGYQGAG
ncbi:MAG: glutaredoxin domain-containing protein [Bacillota bacterium]